MPVPKCHDTDYINASPKLFSCTEAAKVQPKGPDPPAHDAFTRLLLRIKPDRQGSKAVGATAIEAGATVVHLAGYRLIRVFRIVSRDGDTEYWATDDLAMDELTWLGLAETDMGGSERVHRSTAVRPCTTA